VSESPPPPRRRRYKYIYRVDANLVTEERLRRLQRIRDVLGLATQTATICALVDEGARKLGVFDDPEPKQ
jgi:hypothetical protein